MASRIDIDEIQATRGEKLLAVVLALFLLIGGIWAYDRLDVRANGFDEPAVSAADQAAIERYRTAQQEAARAAETARQARADLELAREEYRTALDAGLSADALERDYRAAQASFERAENAREAAVAREAAARPASAAASERAAEARRERARADARTTFLLRLAFVLSALASAYWLFARLRGSRYLTVASAAVGAAAILAFVMGADYVTDYVEWRDLGPLVLSAVGVALTLTAFWGLQRYLARRIPLSRVRKGECPFCGHPVGAGDHCEGCGRAVVGTCARCSARRRIGTAFCAACGEA